MKTKPTASIVDHFQELVDPRIERNKKHSLIDIIVLTVCAVICGNETWEEIEDYGKYKESWLRTLIPLENGIPSHDTIRRLFIRLDPEELQNCFLSWIESVRKVIDGDVIAVDGKTLRRSGEQVSHKAPIHMVSAWAAETGLLLGQKKTAEKSNEITAIPALLELLHLQGCIVTIDAMGCQSAIAAVIQEKQADYVLALKGNQPQLYEDVQFFFHELDQKDLDQKPYIESSAFTRLNTSCDHQGMVPREFQSRRQELIEPVANGFKDWLEEKSLIVRPNSKLGLAD